MINIPKFVQKSFIFRRHMNFYFLYYWGNMRPTIKISPKTIEYTLWWIPTGCYEKLPVTHVKVSPTFDYKTKRLQDYLWIIHHDCDYTCLAQVLKSDIVIRYFIGAPRRHHIGTYYFAKYVFREKRLWIFLTINPSLVLDRNVFGNKNVT